MVVQHNIPAMNANRYFGINNSGLSKSLEKLSSGYAINRAGDNAAGLAVSEKMRSQIAGLTQGVKNAQDGISMIQTFEGALTETDSILQRMKTLADQAANGTYQDDVDRDAIQLEFDQLNDELNQIADTDFNGVIVLNGGEMADGLKQVDGKFDYSNKEAQLVAKANEEYNAKFEAANQALMAAKDKAASTPYDLSANGFAPEWGSDGVNGLDNSQYDKDAADAVWTAMNWVDDNDDVDTSRKQEITVTFKFDGTDWTADSGVDNEGVKYKADDLTAAFGTTVAAGSAGTGNGGFTVTNAKVNASFDAIDAKEGDTVTIKFTNNAEDKKMPNNIAFAYDSFKVEDRVAGVSNKGLDTTTVTIELNAAANDDFMSDNMEKALNSLNGLKFEATYNGSINDAGVTFSWANPTGAGDLTKNVKTTDTTAVEISDGLFVKYDSGAYVFMDADEQEIGKLTVPAVAPTVDGKVSGTITVDAERNKPSGAIRVEVGKDLSGLGTSTEAKKLIADAQAAYDAVVASKPDGTLEGAKKFLGGDNVSVSDALDNATAPLTYTDHVMLQSGARSKDLVDFTFKYSSGGMGDLKANMNCSAREDGLNTASLSLKDQKSANFAIDRIDNAINKVSMVRATFGAVQNRLEHKIDNMNVTKENLTSAESRIRDTNMAEEMTNFTKNQILSQASQAMLAQANQLPQGVLQLLG